MSVCTQCQNSLLSEKERCAACESAGGYPWVPLEFSDTAMERALITLSIVRADGGLANEVPILQGELLLNAKADILPEDSEELDQARVRISFQEGGLFIEDLGEGDGLFRRTRDKEALLLPCELRMGGHRFLLEELEPYDRVPQPEFWGAPRASFRARLIDLLEGGLIGDVFLLHEGINVVGREKGDIVCHPTDNFISGRHAHFHVEDNLFILNDMKSSNGTFIRVHGAHPVFDGDQFLMGPHLLKFALMAKI